MRNCCLCTCSFCCRQFRYTICSLTNYVLLWCTASSSENVAQFWLEARTQHGAILFCTKFSSMQIVRFWHSAFFRSVHTQDASGVTACIPENQSIRRCTKSVWLWVSINVVQNAYLESTVLIDWCEADSGQESVRAVMWSCAATQILSLRLAIMFTIDTFNSIFLFTNGFSLPVFCTFPHVRMICVWYNCV